MSKLLSVRQAADQLSVSEISVRRMVKDGRLQHVRIGRCLRVPLDSVEKAVKQNTAEGQ